MEYHGILQESLLCLSGIFPVLLYDSFVPTALYDFPPQGKDSLKRQQRKIEDG